VVSKNDWPEGFNSSKIGRARPGVGGFAVKRRNRHRDCRQKPDAFSPYDLRLTFRSGILKSIMRVITFSGLANHLVDRIPDFQLLNCEYDIVTSIKRKQMSFVTGCINTGSAELSAQFLVRRTDHERQVRSDARLHGPIAGRLAVSALGECY